MLSKFEAAFRETNAVVDTVVLIKSAETSSCGLEIEGWCIAFDSVIVDKIEVLLEGRRPLLVKRYEYGLESPEGAQEIPQVPIAANCRFSLSVEVPCDSISSLPDRLICVRPLSGGLYGASVACMVMPEGFVPPNQEDVKFIGGGFFTVGLEFLGHLLRYTKLSPDSSVLDVGCGVGRMAYPLSRYLAPAGKYEGFDIWDGGIAWARRHISDGRPNFTFRKVDLYNKFYNPSGRVKSSDFTFPYDDESFDVIFLTSVFTHMYAQDVRRYLDEIYRVLKKGGECLFTCWLINEETAGYAVRGQSRLDFSYALPECFTAYKEVPENAIGFEESKMKEWIGAAGFVLRQTRYGYWCGRNRFTSYQDIVIVEKN